MVWMISSHMAIITENFGRTFLQVVGYVQESVLTPDFGQYAPLWPPPAVPYLRLIHPGLEHKIFSPPAPHP